MKSLRQHAITSAIGAIAFASLAHANLIINGGFETGDLTGWNINGGGVFTNSFAGQTGNSSAWLGASGFLNYLSQTFATQVGQTYDVSFRFYGVNAGPQELDVLFGAPEVLPVETGLTTYFDYADLFTLGGPHNNEEFNLDQPRVWLSYDFSVEATSATSELIFASRQDPGYDHLDEVSVIVEPTSVPIVPTGPSAVPEPSTFGWLGAVALFSVAGLRRWRPKSIGGQKA